jgi:DNA-binding NarL/FixJ family response regulator
MVAGMIRDTPHLPSTPALTVLIVDDHPIVLAGLRMLLEVDQRFTICAEARNVAEACAAAVEWQPDLVIADLALTGRDDGLELVRELGRIAPDARTLVYSSSDERDYARLALAAGARGYVSKVQGLPYVAEALQTIADGGIEVSSVVREQMDGEAAGSPIPDGLAALSSRERQVLDMIGSGASLAAIAQQLRVSVKTVGTYRDRIKTKLGMDNARMLDRFAAARRSTGG